MGENPLRHKSFAVWQGQHFSDFRMVNFYISEQKALEDIEIRLSKSREIYIKKLIATIGMEDKIIINSE